MASIKIRTKRQNGITEIRTLITHPMETGRNRDQVTGEYIPEHFIQELTVKINHKIVIYTTMAAGISKNPFFSFQISDAIVGDRITIHWLDNFGHEDFAESAVK
jgi:sulfur-oxidizing protein SoxZ